VASSFNDTQVAHRPARSFLRVASGLGGSPFVGQLAALRGELGLVVALLAVAFVAHGFNMFNLPAFTYNGDEGIYTGQALAGRRVGQSARRAAKPSSH
jgi:hypothetical protein